MSVYINSGLQDLFYKHCYKHSVSLNTVSYTHLDVYKRQTSYSMECGVVTSSAWCSGTLFLGFSVQVASNMLPTTFIRCMPQVIWYLHYLIFRHHGVHYNTILLLRSFYIRVWKSVLIVLTYNQIDIQNISSILLQ